MEFVPTPPMACGNILVVEDDRDIRETIQQILELEGYNAVPASNGQEALDLLKKHPGPCLILLDLMMPVMDGWQFLEMKNSQAMIASIPVLVVSAVADRVETNKAGVAGMIKKPIDMDKLLAVCKAYCCP